jgi:anti-sigma regulatory factor (Ser/Thr protein kinase)/GNAT superfamily N-acetyltransferase
MEAHLHLEARLGIVGSATDFTYKWCLNMGLGNEEASRMALAADEILTDIILYAYKEEQGYIEIWFRYSMSEIEIIIQEKGEPFDISRHQFSREKALDSNDFSGASFEVVKKMTDHFLFLNRGKDGKEFRIVKKMSAVHIADTTIREEADETNGEVFQEDYLVTPITSEDAEDIAKLIYRSYGFRYNKEDLYFPRRIETALMQDYKFGTIVRTSAGGPAGYFAVIRSTDSMIGEIGEAVVSPEHRNRGLMTRMLKELIYMSRQRGLLGLFGMALTSHTISQKVNAKYGLKSTALILTKSYRSDQSIADRKNIDLTSVVLDYISLLPHRVVPVYLPSRHQEILEKIYSQFVQKPEIRKLPDKIERQDVKTDLQLNVRYDSETAVVIVRQYGKTFEHTLNRLLDSIEDQNFISVYVDLPLDNVWIDPAAELLYGKGFVFAGLLPQFHQERDYLRLQRVIPDPEFDSIETVSEMAGTIKEYISKEYNECKQR